MPTAVPTDPPPLPGLSPLFDASAMRAADAAAEGDLRIPSILLMERAGLGTARSILARYPDAGRATVVAGKGNNGGDGMVVARHLAEAGWRVEIVVAAGRATGEDAATMAVIVDALGVPVGPLPPDGVPPAGVVVDALLGTGARGAPRGAVADAIAWIGAAQGPVVSCDVPSGVEADTGRVPGAAVRADLTVTYHGDKVGLRVAPGRSHCGEVEVLDIGIPGAVRSPASAWLTGSAVLAAIPSKGAGGDKYAAGATLVVAGSEGMSGAACLCSEATLRAGGGLTVAVVPEAIREVCARTVPEVMFGATAGAHLDPSALEEIHGQAGRVAALVLGPGIGRAEETGSLVREVLSEIDLPAVVDADALFHLAEAPAVLRGRDVPTILTPHTGEAARILGVDREEVAADRLACAARLAELTGAHTVLKGPGTIIAAPGQAPIVNAIDTPILSSAGTGDVLAGALGALLAKGMEARAAAAAGVTLHGAAARRLSGDGATATDLLAALPHALGER